VKAYVGNTLCGTATTFSKLVLPSGAQFPVWETHYVVDVAAARSLNPGCGYNGASVRFVVGAFPAATSGTWTNWQLNYHNLFLVVRVAR
jgi:hypothetical protein